MGNGLTEESLRSFARVNRIYNNIYNKIYKNIERKQHIQKSQCYSEAHLSFPDRHVEGLQMEQGDGVSSLALLSTQETRNNGHIMEMRWGAKV